MDLLSVYVGAISGEPIFESFAKYDAETGWPSFSAAVPGSIIERLDPNDLASKQRISGFTGKLLKQVFASGF